jgi:integrase
MHRYEVEMLANEMKEATLDTDRLALGKLDEFLKGKRFEDASKEDIIGFFAAVTPNYKPSYVHLIKRRAKHFYSWLFDLERGEYPLCVRWIRSTNPRRATKVKGIETSISPQNVLNDEDVHRFLAACDHPRDAAIVSLLYEIGVEANEMLALKVGSIMFDLYGARVSLEGTGGKRVLRIVDSIGYVQNWINFHPDKENLEAPLWAIRPSKLKNAKSQKLRAMSYSNLMRILYRLKRMTGIEKPVSCVALRHACLTKMAKVLPEQLLKRFAGWTPDSKMASVYVHLDDKDVGDALLKAHGREAIEIATFGASILTPKKCPRCQTEIMPTWAYCPKCSLTLVRGPEFDINVLMSKLSTDREEMMRLWKKYGLPMQAWEEKPSSE